MQETEVFLQPFCLCAFPCLGVAEGEDGCLLSYSFQHVEKFVFRYNPGL